MDKQRAKQREWLIELRKNAGLSQQDLADTVGISRSYLCEIETGVKSPGGSLALRLANKLNFDMSLFFEHQSRVLRIKTDETSCASTA